MKYVKMLGLAALAATALVAVMAASASANAKVCSTQNGNPIGADCKAGHGKVYNGPVSASLTPGTGGATFAEGPIHVACSTSSASGTITNGATGTGNITSVTFAGCSSILGPCTWSASASAANPFPATTTTHGLVEDTRGWMDVSNITLQHTCIGITCKYDKPISSSEITLDGSDVAGAARLTVNVLLTLETGQPGFCGTAGDPLRWTATYTINTPSTLMIE
jgi:hypothetical protein